ncbi:hypothetical protein D3C73_1261950 [compost metagenome]
MRTIAQRRQVERQYIQTIIEIFAEQTFLYQLHQIFLRGANHTDINVNLMIFADAAEGPVIKKTQQFGLHARRHFANFIQQY